MSLQGSTLNGRGAIFYRFLMMIVLTIANYGAGYVAYSQMVPAILLWGSMLTMVGVTLLYVVSMIQPDVLMEMIGRVLMPFGVSNFHFAGDPFPFFLKGYAIISGIAMIIGEVIERLFPNKNPQKTLRSYVKSQILFVLLMPLFGYLFIFGTFFVSTWDTNMIFGFVFFYFITALMSMYALGARWISMLIRGLLQHIASQTDHTALRNQGQ